MDESKLLFKDLKTTVLWVLVQCAVNKSKHICLNLPMKSYINTAIAEVAEGIANNKNNLFCQVPENSFDLG